jgi:aminoglycoside phosphotransferase family enzyme/predicted kinase
MAQRISREALIDGLRDGRAYAPAPDAVSMLETHASLLFFAGERVYKVKKPVAYGFLDFSTLERRRFYCEEEMRLNRRLAPEVYLGVVAVTRDGDGRVRIGGEGAVVEYAVEMVRLPAARMLDRLLDEDRVTDAELDAVAERIAAFHATARADAEVAAFGAPEAVAARVRENLDECAALVGDLPREARGDAPVLGAWALERLRASTEAELLRLRPLLARRAEAGFVREGHGDLHAGNICLPVGGGVIAYDCIEFEPAFRCVDVGAEIAFLAMDLERRGHVAQAARVVDRYCAASGDDGARAVQALFRCHYACVRGKVTALRARGGADGGAAAWREAVASFQLALGSTLAPACVVMTGLPGTGKSSWARCLAPAIRAAVVRTDEVRKSLAGLGPTERGDSEILYSKYITEITYSEAARRGRAAIAAGRSVVLDAMAPTRERRAQLFAAGGVGVIAHCVCDDATTLERLERRRAAGTDASDADASVFLALRERYEPPGAREAVIVLDCDEPAWLGVDRVLGFLARACPISE